MRFFFSYVRIFNCRDSLPKQQNPYVRAYYVPGRYNVEMDADIS